MRDTYKLAGLARRRLWEWVSKLDGYYDGRRGYSHQRYRPARYRVEYHHRYRGW